MEIKKRLSFSLIILLLSVSCNTNRNEPCPGCIEDPILKYRLIDIEPTWSPDGKWIAFYHGVPGQSGIYLISPDGENINKWHYGIPETPAWSPDGKWIAFSQGAQIWKKKIDGDSLTQLTFEGRNFFPSWSPDGKNIIYDGWIMDKIKFHGIWRIDNAGINSLIKYDEHTGDIRMPHCGLDFIVYAKYSPEYFSMEIYCMGYDGSNEKRLTFNESTDNYPKVSNNKIAFLSQPKDKPHLRIWVMDADGSNLKRLTDTQSYACDWSPDGKQIVYTNAEADNGRLWIMDADGTNKRQLTFEHHFINF